MSIYALAKPIFFQFDAEFAHDMALKSLNLAQKSGLLNLYPKPPSCAPRQIMGLTFPNAVGLAAGLDKNGAVIDGMAKLGFGFIEVGTVTPRPQSGNPKPRLFRVTEAQGIINRFGFNNLGVDNLVENAKAAKFSGILGINIGKNFDTPNDRAVDDYIFCMQKVYAHADYITVNISSPNTKNLRDLQAKDVLSSLLASLKLEQQKLAEKHGKYVPVTLKIAPDLDEKQVVEIANLLMQHQYHACARACERHEKWHRSGRIVGRASAQPFYRSHTAIISTTARCATHYWRGWYFKRRRCGRKNSGWRNVGTDI
jgi:dihydroorotate dehydrogenase